LQEGHGFARIFTDQKQIRIERVIREIREDPWLILHVEFRKTRRMSARRLARVARADSRLHQDGLLEGADQCGFKHIDAVSFVSPKAVPQMADSEEVLRNSIRPMMLKLSGSWSTKKGSSGDYHRVGADGGLSLFRFADVFAEQPAPVARRRD